MNNSFFRNQQQNQARSSPKVISVPVNFISSSQKSTLSMSKASAALKIQTLFRGFLVRKSVKKIASIRNEVSEIERRIDEVADLIRRDGKERLRVNETLMSLLFKLDSIRGFDFGVRELRKAVTRKAIALQDSIANNKTLAKIEPDTSTSEETYGSGDEDRRKEDHTASMEKMMKVMIQISERNERMINSLSRRVEQLEKAFMKRKKKTRAASLH